MEKVNNLKVVRNGHSISMPMESLRADTQHEAGTTIGAGLTATCSCTVFSVVLKSGTFGFCLCLMIWMFLRSLRNTL